MNNLQSLSSQVHHFVFFYRGTNNAEVNKIFRFRFDLASLRLSPERTSLFLSPKFRERNFKKVQLCMILIEDICKPKCHH